MLYINRFLDSEYNDSVQYEEFVITNKNCNSLISELLNIWNELDYYDNIGELLADADFSIADNTKTALAYHLNENRDDFGGWYEFVITILDDNDLLTNYYKINTFEY